MKWFAGWRVRMWMSWSLVLSGIGCSAPHDETRTQVGDTTFVFSGAPLHDTATLREVLRIGTPDGDPNYMFHNIVNFTVAPSGDIYIAGSGGDIRRFDSAGNFIRRVARSGQGPGEVDYAVGLDVAADGRLAVLDFGNQRVSIYAPDGSFERQTRRPPGRPYYGRDAIQWGSAGDIWVGLNPPRTREGARDDGLRPIYGRLIGDETVVDTLFLDPHSEECYRRDPAYARGYYEDGRLAHLPFYHWTRGASGALASGCSVDYLIDVLRTDGTVLRTSRAWEPAIMDDEQYAFWLEYSGEASKTRPAYLRMWLAPDGRLWVRPGTDGESRLTSAAERSQGFPDRVWTSWAPTDGFDVFEADGSWLGHVRTPQNWVAAPFPGNRDPQFMGDTIWAVTSDELDVPYLSKFVVEWPAADRESGAP